MRAPIKFFMVLALLSAAYGVRGEGFSYVFDSDKFVFVRAEPGAGSPVVDTVYHLQVVWTGGEMNGWVEAYGGWVHGSRLRPMPAGTEERLSGLVDSSGFVFIAGPDMAHIVLCPVVDYRPKLPVKSDRFYNEDAPLTVRGGDIMSACNLHTGLKIWEWEFPSYFDRLEIYNGRTMVCSAYGNTVFMRDATGGRVMVNIPTSAYPAYTDAETAEALATAVRLENECRGKDEQTSREIWRRDLGTNKFEMLYRLRAAYLAGSREAADLYPFMLGIADCDGGDCHGLDDLFSEWEFLRHAGVNFID